jgi:hypothetical protein
MIQTILNLLLIILFLPTIPPSLVKVPVVPKRWSPSACDAAPLFINLKLPPMAFGWRYQVNFILPAG